MTIAQQIAAFSTAASWERMSAAARERLKICVLDALGCAVGALGARPMQILRAHTDELGGAARCTLIGGGRSAPDRAAFYNHALVRYIDFNDSYLGEKGTCHPSDNLGAVLAAAELADCSGRDFIAALAVAYQVQCRLTGSLPVMKKGFDHCSILAYAVAAGAARALGLDEAQTAHAVSISGDSALSLTVTRAHPMSNWKGLAAPQTAFGCMQTTLLAMRGITGPLHVFEGPKGFFEATGEKVDIDWTREDLEMATRVTVKRYNAEVHTQSVLEAVLDLRDRERFTADDVEQVRVEVFRVAYDITGGGAWCDRTDVRIKEEADHSLPYMVAVAILDGQVLPEQYEAERIVRADVQGLLHKVLVMSRYRYTRRYPDEMPCRVTVWLRDGRRLVQDKRDFEGFVTRPQPWATVQRKFERLAAPFTSAPLRRELTATVARLQEVPVRELTRLLAQAGETAARVVA